MHAAAEWRQDADAPVADLVPEPLDDDRAIGGDDSRDRFLLAEEREEVPGGARVEPVLVLDPSSRVRVRERGQLTGGLADLLPELGGAPDALALPERGDPGHAGSGRHEDAVAGDLLDPPRGRAQQERLALTRLVDHLL